MIYSTIEEIRIIIYLIGYGIFIISTYDTIYLVTKKIKKVIKILINIIYVISIIYFTYEFSYSLASGYIPITFILFLISGFLIYSLIRKSYLEGLTIIIDFLIKIRKTIIKIIIFLFYPKEIISIISLIIGTIKVTICNFLRSLKKKNKKWNNKLSK